MRYQATLRLQPCVMLSLAVILCGAGRPAPALAQATPPKKILFVSNRDDKATFNIYSMNADGTEQTRLSKSSTTDFDPVWSPDGKQIAFITIPNLQDKKTQLNLMNADGSQRKTVANLDDMAFTPVWSPDGKQIAFSSTDGRTAGNAPPKFLLHIMDADGKNRRDVGEGILSAWSSDGKRFLLAKFEKKGKASEPVLYALDIEGGNLKPISDTAAMMGVWSPDGKRIVYIAVEPAGPPNIFVMNADGTQKTRLTTTKSVEISPQWSSDGQHILFTRLALPRDTGDPTTTSMEIYRMDTDGKNIAPLTSNGAMNLLGSSGFFLIFLTAAPVKPVEPPRLLKP